MTRFGSKFLKCMGIEKSKMLDKEKINCEIKFDSNVFYPTDNLTGNVVISSIDIDTPSLIDQITLEVFGEARCKWKYNKYLVKRKLPFIYKKNRSFLGRDVFFFKKHYMIRNRLISFTIDKIPRQLPFKVELIEHLPASWNGQFGEILYTVHVLIKDVDNVVQTFSREVTIGASRNLTLEKHLLNEARQDVCRQYFYSFISLGSVEVSVWLPVCGVSGGQSIPILCTITNNSSILFSGLVFVLTQIEIYRSQKPTKAVKTHRTDISRVPRIVDIFKGKYQYYCILRTDNNLLPTNQYFKCSCCQITYEVWVSLKGALPRYKAYGYPNIDTPSIPIIIGTKPLYEWNCSKITDAIMNTVYELHRPIISETLPPVDKVKDILQTIDEKFGEPSVLNKIGKQYFYKI